MDPIIQVSNFSFRYGTLPVLRNVSLSIQSGESLAIVGPNGAGKSTLLKCLGGIVEGGEGQIDLDGKSLKTYTHKELACRMSYVPQSDGRNIPFTVHEFVMMGRYPHLSPFSLIQPEDRKAVDEALERTGAASLSDRRLSSLSGGERQKVLVAAALAQQSPILLLDEPTTFLDYRHQAEIESILWHAKRDRGVTLVAVTHDINIAAMLADRIVALKDGEVVFDGPPEKVMTGEVLQSIYDKPFLLVPHPETGLPMVVPERIKP